MTALILASALYLGVPLDGSASKGVERYESREAIPGGEGAVRWKTDWILLRRVDPGRATLGVRTKKMDTLREVEITKPYYMGVYEVTRRQWERVTGAWHPDGVDPEPAKRPTRPVAQLCTDEVRGRTGDGVDWPSSGARVGEGSFLGRLRERTGLGFDLPTEAQWEYACRAGSTNAWHSGAGLSLAPVEGWSIPGDRELMRLGRCAANGGMVPNGALGRLPAGEELATYGPAEVGAYVPNAWGLYDMHGNVYELCLDWYRVQVGPESAGADPKGPAENDSPHGLPYRVIRGGSWWNYLYGSPHYCAAWERSFGGLVFTHTRHSAVGMRLVLPAGN